MGQEMRMSPRLIQAMEILQLPALALLERIDAELVSNPVLEVQETASDEPAEPAESYADDRGERQMVVDERGNNAEDFSRLDEMTNEYGSEWIDESPPAPSASSYDGEPDRKLEAMANTAAPDETLNEYLHEQWRFVEAEPPVKAAGSLLIDYIDADGYLRTPISQVMLETMAEADDLDEPAGDGAAQPQARLDEQAFRQAMTLLQTLDPAGVGAADLGQCLLLQLDRENASSPDVETARRLARDFLRDIEMNRLPQIARKLHLSIDQVKAGIDVLSHLNPKPGLLIGQSTAPAVTPDVIVEIDDDGHIVVQMADEYIPGLTINEQYQRQARSKNADAATKQFLRRNIRSAEWLIEAIQQRRNTIRRVSEEVFKVQREFLDQGPEALKPLPMADIAAKVDVHVATVSRAVADKYVQTPRGIVPLRMFFSGGTKTAAGDDMSWDAVKVKLQEIVDNEDKAKPLSDDALAEELNKAGIDIARRTVAKYRGLLDIPPARKRKEY
jgi:RNA polymerase sigma-54 factor